MYKQDWIMRRIEILMQVGARLIFNSIEYIVHDADNLLYYKLEKLLA